MLLTGTFYRSVDDKQRLSIPKRIRTVLEKTGSPALYVAPGLDGSLAIYTEEEFERFARRLADTSPTGRNVVDFSRLFYAKAQGVEMDGQGRIRVPAE